MAPEGLLQRLLVVERQDDRVARGGRWDAGARRDAERGEAASGFDQQGVDVAVVAAFELEHQVAAGTPAGEPDRRLGRLGAGVDEPESSR